MKWIISGFMMLLLITSSPGTEPELFSPIDFDEARLLGKQEGKSVLVKFHAEWCHYCAKMDKEVFSSKEVRDALKDVIVIKVDVETEDGENLAREHGVTALPTILFFTPEGELVYGRPGFHSSQLLLTVLEGINGKI